MKLTVILLFLAIIPFSSLAKDCGYVAPETTNSGLLTQFPMIEFQLMCPNTFSLKLIKDHQRTERLSKDLLSRISEKIKDISFEQLGNKEDKKEYNQEEKELDCFLHLLLLQRKEPMIKEIQEEFPLPQRTRIDFELFYIALEHDLKIPYEISVNLINSENVDLYWKMELLSKLKEETSFEDFSSLIKTIEEDENLTQERSKKLTTLLTIPKLEIGLRLYKRLSKHLTKEDREKYISEIAFDNRFTSEEEFNKFVHLVKLDESRDLYLSSLAFHYGKGNLPLESVLGPLTLEEKLNFLFSYVKNPSLSEERIFIALIQENLSNNPDVLNFTKRIRSRLSQEGDKKLLLTLARDERVSLHYLIRESRPSTRKTIYKESLMRGQLNDEELELIRRDGGLTKEVLSHKSLQKSHFIQILSEASEVWDDSFGQENWSALIQHSFFEKELARQLLQAVKSQKPHKEILYVLDQISIRFEDLKEEVSLIREEIQSNNMPVLLPLDELMDEELFDDLIF
jgi:AraC-like DNA-binding protein